MITISLFQTKVDFPTSKQLDLAGLELFSYFLNQNQAQGIPLRPCLESYSPCSQRFPFALYNLGFFLLFFFSWI